MNRFLPLKAYWRERRDLEFYEVVIKLAKEYVPSGKSVIDVGAHNTEVLLRLEGFDYRVGLDKTYPPQRRGIKSIKMHFMRYRPEVYFDLVLCLQVLEHLKDPEAFAQKLLQTGETIIVSVPYQWPEGSCESHIQDPVDDRKLASSVQRAPAERLIVANGVERLIAVYQN
jgi:hypothetical protein